jgi:hypothetical protein
MTHKQNIYPMDEQEKAAELAAQAEVKEEEVRQKVIEDFGFDEVEDAEKIEKLVKKEVESRQKLSQAIGQKIKYRTELEKAKETPPTPKPDAPKGEDIDAVVAKKLEQRDLDELDFPDDIKKEIQRIANLQGVSIKQALRDPYIVHRTDEYTSAKKLDEAAISNKPRSGGKKSYSLDAPPEVDMSTPEGREEWDKYMSWAKKQ